MPQTVLYKYCDRFGIEALENLTLKVTPPNQFNDIFEVTPRPSPEELSVSRLKELLESSAYKTHLEQHPPKSEEKFARAQALARANPEELHRIVAPQMSELKEHICSRYLDAISEVFGVICLAGNPRHLLLWGHYSNGHRGLVIGLDTRELSFGAIVDIHYVRERVEMAEPWSPAPTTREFAIAVINSKSDLWCYEGERRILLRLSDVEKRWDKNAWLYLQSFPASAITEVILGYRTPVEDVRRVFAAVDKHGINPLITRVKPHPSRFSLNFEDEIRPSD